MNRAADPLYAGPRQNPGQPASRTPDQSSSRSNDSESISAESIAARAQKFEDEKRRIIESLFAKKDTDGSVVESYITHVRIIEDAAYSATPPPPSSDPQNKKDRVIIVAVRKSGRVRVHKARENANGSFSIGKTWDLDSLGPIQTYHGLTPTNLQEQQHKFWAGNVGFVVTLGKPYYWAALTIKEKDFFVGSLVKIYRKYTGGKLPDLIGFPPQELAQLKGGTPQRSPDPAVKSPNLSTKTPPAASPALQPVNRPTPLYSSRAPSNESGTVSTRDAERAGSRNGFRPAVKDEQRTPVRDDFRSPSRPGYPLSGGDESRNASRDARGENREASRDESRDARDKLQDQAVPGRPQFNFGSNSSQSSLQNSMTATGVPRSEANGVSPGLRPPNERSAPRFGETPSSDSLNRSLNTPSVNSRPSTAASGRAPSEAGSDRPQVPNEPLPNRRLPPGIKPAESFERSAETSKFSTPLATPSAITSEPPALSIQDAPVPSASKGPDYFHSTGVEGRGREVSETTSTGRAAPRDASASKAEPSTAENGLFASPPQLPADQQADAELENHRPGLGPMIKKKSAKEIASTFRRAALAATAFQPRAGGAGARLMAQKEKEKPSAEPDGINAVVPAPLLRGMSSDSGQSGPPEIPTPGSEKERPFSPLSKEFAPKVQLQRTATEGSMKIPEETSNEPPKQKREVRATSPEKARSRSPGRRRRQRQQAGIEKYCGGLGIDPKILDSRGGDYLDMLEEFGWEGKLVDDHSAENLTADLRREIGRAQATGWLGHIEQQDEKIKELGKAFDKVIEECEELDGLFTLYSHELGTLRDDVEYIEAQSQGLQVQTANQKLLQVELQGLLKTLTISASDTRALKDAPLEDAEGLYHNEQALSVLYQAMQKIDPAIRQNRIRQADATVTDRSGIGVYADRELGQMRAVREKKEEYNEETTAFLRRFNGFLVNAFRVAEFAMSDTLEHDRGGQSVKLDVSRYSTTRSGLWMYNALLLFVREVNSYEWKTLVGRYEMCIKNAYQEQFRDHVGACKKTVRRAGGDEEALFTTLQTEKSDEGIAARRGLTIKRAKTSKHVARNGLGEHQDGKGDAYEVFGRLLDQEARAIAEEQNFIAAFFHLSSRANDDFAEMINSRSPAQRRPPNLHTMLTYEPDRDMAKILEQAVDSIYSFWSSDMHNLIDWVLSYDQLQGVGVLRLIEGCLANYEETNQEYIIAVLRKLHERLSGLFHRFVDTQIAAIEEVKVKIHKRKGIISFMKTFPIFSAAVENMLPQTEPGHESLEVRFIVNEAYGKINKVMWESLTFIAKEPGHGAAVATQNSNDPEDKEALNYHILLIENANHYIEEVETQGNVTLDEWKEKAQQEFHTHMHHYCDAVIRRPLGKWFDFVEGTEALLKSNDGPATNIAAKPSHSRSTAKKLLAQFDLKEIKKGVETLKKRIEKHFGDADEPGLNKKLVETICAEAAARYAGAHDRMRVIVESVYGGELSIEWRKEEVNAMFRR